MTRSEKIRFGVLIGVLVLALLCGSGVRWWLRGMGRAVWEGIEQWDPNEQPWVECPVDLPEETGRVVFLRRHAHPFLAEYDRQIRYESAGGAVTRDLPMNTGGKTRISVYYYAAKDGQGPFVKFCDRHGNYSFDLGNDANEVRFVPEPLTGTYIGRLDGREGPLRFVPVGESPDEPIERMP